jgi:tRNA(Ile)-lysidine synthase
MRVLDRFAERLEGLRLGNCRVLVAVSGGADSVALLDLLVQSREHHHLELIVAHIDHGIQPESALVAHEVEALAHELGLRYLGTRLGLGPKTTETRARVARYEWLRATRHSAGARWILTAHHADDQRETVLMRALRGSGPAGLAGMATRERGVARPLLTFSRRTLRRYCRSRGLRWWNDPANRDPRHLRSWIRGALLPDLAERMPDIGLKLGELRRHAARDRRAWDEALWSWPGLDADAEHGSCSVLWPVLLDLPVTLACCLAESLVRAAGAPAGATRVRRALSALAYAQSGATADLTGGWRLELAFGRLRVVPPATPGTEVPRFLTAEEGQTLWGSWRIRWSSDVAPEVQARDGRTAWFIPAPMALRPWRPGDRLAPLGGIGHRLAVRCFQDARIPRSERIRWPMVEVEGTLAWIPGVCRGDALLPVAGTPAVRIDVEPRG